jgi:hypothetical protein
MNKPQPRLIPNPLWCDRCEWRGYLVHDGEWEPYAVECPDCANQTTKIIDAVLRDVAELPDRTSPDEWPEALLVTADELRSILLHRLNSCTPT